MHSSRCVVLLAVVAAACAAPQRQRRDQQELVDPRHPMITPAPVAWPPTGTGTFKYRRDLLSDVEGDVNSVLSGLGSGIPSYVASGVPNFFQDFPTGTAVASSLSLNSSQIDALPTGVLNLPPYGNFSDEGWQIRFRANVYKQPNISSSKLDDLANVFLPDTSVQSLPPAQASQARNLTAEIFVVQQPNVNITFSLAPAPTSGPDGGAIQPSGGSQTIAFPTPATDEGDIDGFAKIKGDGLKNGNETNSVQRLSVWTKGADDGNATAYLVPDEGITIVSDIDDILRVTRIYEPKDGLLNSFARPFTPWMNMPDIYANLSQSLKNLHFHYLTTTPEQITRNYMDFIYKTYPAGSFDTRPLNFSDVDATLSIRKYLLEKIFQTFPKRKFILVGDVSNSDIMRDYPDMVSEFPGQVQCIWLRNTTATDTDNFPYDTSGFKNLNQQTYMFFVVPDDLTNLDVGNGQCLNASIKQNLTFGYQGLLLKDSSGPIRFGAEPGRLLSWTSWSFWLGLSVLVYLAL